MGKIFDQILKNKDIQKANEHMIKAQPSRAFIIREMQIKNT